MDVLRPLRVSLFFYEVLRLLVLVIFMVLVPMESRYQGGAFHFPYVIYLSSNALFPLMALFIWLKPEEHLNYLPLYMAGKVIGGVSFYIWELFSARQFLGIENAAMGVILIGGTAFLSLADIFSIWGAWIIKNRFRKLLETVPESGGK